MKKLSFHFEPWRKEEIYDDHGGHYHVRTDYHVFFNVNGIAFWAHFSNFGKSIDVSFLNNLEHITFIRGLKTANTNEAETVIKNAFYHNDKLKTAIDTHCADILQTIKPFDLGHEWD